MKSISLLLMSYKGLYTLTQLCEAGYAPLIDKVIFARDRGVQKDYVKEMQACCMAYQIPCYYRVEQVQINSPFALAISWRWLLNLSQTKLIVLHDSLLPKYRGFAPLVSQLINQEKEIGLTAIFASEKGYDQGPIISQWKKEISFPIKIQECIEILAKGYAELSINIFREIASGSSLTSYPQEETAATYSLWRDEADYCINWNQSAEDILRFINALGFPYAGASTSLEREKVRIWEAEIYPDEEIVNRDCGKVIFVKEGFPIIVCARGLLMIKAASFDKNGKSLFPLKKFRLRFR